MEYAIFLGVLFLGFVLLKRWVPIIFVHEKIKKELKNKEYKDMHVSLVIRNSSETVDLILVASWAVYFKKTVKAGGYGYHKVIRKGITDKKALLYKKIGDEECYEHNRELVKKEFEYI